VDGWGCTCLLLLLLLLLPALLQWQLCTVSQVLLDVANSCDWGLASRPSCQQFIVYCSLRRVTCGQHHVTH
jgi:hypothetical protein